MRAGKISGHFSLESLPRGSKELPLAIMTRSASQQSDLDSPYPLNQQRLSETFLWLTHRDCEEY